MRVVTWNMGCGPSTSPYRKTHEHAWSYLLDELRPEVVLVQEALVTKLNELERTYSVALCDLGATVTAGTAVLVRGFEATPAQNLSVSLDTYLATVEVRTPARPLVVVAAHVYPGSNQHADLRKLVGVLGSTFGDHPVLIGGDFNAARRFDEVYGGRKHKAFFDAMHGAGFHEIHWALHGREIQSFWGHQTEEPYQDDHFFVTKTLASRARSCDVVDNPTVRRLSDHGPVVLELDVA